MIDKPYLNRAEALRRDRLCEQVERCLESILSLLDESEHLGEPFRLGDEIVVPTFIPEADPAPLPQQSRGQARALMCAILS